MGGASSRNQKDQPSRSTYFNQEELKKLKSSYDEGGLEMTVPLIQEKLKDLDNIELNIAVTGKSGAGKSSFINTMRGLQNNDEGAAKTGTTETTMKPAPYPHPNLPKVCFWDLPGMGTLNFPANEYLKKMNFKQYDFFIIISAWRFTENDVKLTKEIKRLGKNFYFVRSKIDNDLDSVRKEGKKLNKEEEMETIRNDCVSNLEKAGISSPNVFLVSNFEINEFDFQKLNKTLAGNLSDIKKQAFMLSLPNTTLEIIEKKRVVLKKRVWMLATLSGFVGTVPVPGLSCACDTGILIPAIIGFRQYLGLDDASLQRLANMAGKPVEDLKAVVKTPLVGEIDKTFVIKMLLGGTFIAISAVEIGLDFIPVVGSVFGGASSFGMTYKLLNDVLNDLTENAQSVVKTAFGTEIVCTKTSDH
ncbi:interferon-inducible GTPase 5-like [Mustelus asterias]